VAGAGTDRLPVLPEAALQGRERIVRSEERGRQREERHRQREEDPQREEGPPSHRRQDAVRRGSRWVHAAAQGFPGVVGYSCTRASIRTEAEETMSFTWAILVLGVGLAVVVLIVVGIVALVAGTRRGQGPDRRD
jgi:hypothetical protein